MRILVVDDNINSLQSLCLTLKDLGHEPVGLQNSSEALPLAKQQFYPLIITDIRMPGIDGLELLSALKTEPRTEKSDVVLITGHGDMTTAVEALRKGAYDYLNKPINARELAAVVDRCAERQALMMENKALRENLSAEVSKVTAHLQHDLESMRHRLRQVEGMGLVVAASPIMQKLMHEALILHSDPTVPVLIEGETGTGKEIFARLVHHGEGVVDAPFMAINCSAIPGELFESELFGHEQGAFTGSRADGASGKLEQAGKGTLFLDEVAEMPIMLQPKLLRVLEERSFYRVGGMKKRQFEARIVCAGNRNMDEMVEKGFFRRDLYHRLRVGHLYIPPLRERPEDIQPLAEQFLKRETARKKKNFAGISQGALETLLHYPWPGNVRELENTIERAVLMHDSDMLCPEHLQFLYYGKTFDPAEKVYYHEGRILPDRRRGVNGCADGPADIECAPQEYAPKQVDLKKPETLPLPDDSLPLDDLIDGVIQAALNRFSGNKSKAAAYLGISRFTLHRKLQEKDKNKRADSKNEPAEYGA